MELKAGHMDGKKIHRPCIVGRQGSVAIRNREFSCLDTLIEFWREKKRVRTNTRGVRRKNASLSLSIHVFSLFLARGVFTFPAKTEKKAVWKKGFHRRCLLQQPFFRENV